MAVSLGGLGALEAAALAGEAGFAELRLARSFGPPPAGDAEAKRQQNVGWRSQEPRVHQA